MGGRVWASLRQSVGAEFGFTLPIAPADEHDLPVAAPAVH
jgi:signal transduction histidine kinase